MADASVLNQFSEDAKQWGFKALDVQNQLQQLQIQKQHMDLLKDETNIKSAKMIGEDTQKVLLAPSSKLKKAYTQQLFRNAAASGNPVSAEYLDLIQDPQYQTLVAQGLQLHAGAGGNPDAAQALLSLAGSENAHSLLQTMVGGNLKNTGLSDALGSPYAKNSAENNQTALKNASDLAAKGDVQAAQAVKLLVLANANPAMMHEPEINAIQAKYATPGLALQNRQDILKTKGEETKTPAGVTSAAGKDVSLGLVPGALERYKNVVTKGPEASPEEIAQVNSDISEAHRKEQKMKEENDLFKTGFAAQNKLNEDTRAVNKQYLETRGPIDRMNAAIKIVQANPNNTKLVQKQLSRLALAVEQGRQAMTRSGTPDIIEKSGSILDELKNRIDSVSGQGAVQASQVKQLTQMVRSFENVHKELFAPQYHGIMVQAQDAASRPQLKDSFRSGVVNSQIPGEFRGKAGTKHDFKGEPLPSAIKRKPLSDTQKQMIQSGSFSKEQATALGFDTSGL